MARAAELRNGFCHDCEEIRGIRGRGLCDTCFKRRKRRGTLHELPRRPIVIERYKEFLMIRSLESHLSSQQIADRIGVNERTIDRYNQHRLKKRLIRSLEEVGLYE